MNSAEDPRADLRTLVGKITRELDHLPPPTGTQVAALRTCWVELVDALALGPAPELRDCPSCGKSGMRAATRCGFCWTKLAPLAPQAG